jgi:hypothetical protein
VGTGIADVVHWPIVAAEVAAALNQCTAPKAAGATPQAGSASFSPYRVASR